MEHREDAHAISRARFALLNHHAPAAWMPAPVVVGRASPSISTRVEMLALGIGFTVSLSLRNAEAWRIAIGKVAEALVIGSHEPNRDRTARPVHGSTPLVWGDQEEQAASHNEEATNCRLLPEHHPMFTEEGSTNSAIPLELVRLPNFTIAAF